MTTKVSAVLVHETPWWIARCVEVEVTAQGETSGEALESLKEALEVYMERGEIPTLDEPPHLEMVEVGK